MYMYDHMVFSRSSRLVDPGCFLGVRGCIKTGPGRIKTEIGDEIFFEIFSKSVEVHVLWVIFPKLDLTAFLVVFGHFGPDNDWGRSQLPGQNFHFSKYMYLDRST